MAIRLKPKSFGPVFALYNGSKITGYAFGDPSNSTPYPSTQTPIDTLLTSLAYCIVLSAELAAGENNTKLNPFIIKVSGIKALDLPSRIEKMNITILGQLVEDSSVAERIMQRAKSICTVSNTLSCEVSIATEPDFYV
jgi:uncharacterized OsmC-like protein